MTWKKDVLPWLGPEIAIGLIDVVGSVVAAENGGPPILVVLIGTREPDRASAILLTSIRRQEKEEEIKFETQDLQRPDDIRSPGRQGALCGNQGLPGPHLRPRLDGGYHRPHPGLQDRRLPICQCQVPGSASSLPENRFSTLYVDSETIWLNARRQFGEDIPWPRPSCCPPIPWPFSPLPLTQTWSP